MFCHFLQAASVDGIEIQFIHGREGFSEVRRVQDGLFRSGNVILIDAGETEKQGRRNHREFDDDPLIFDAAVFSDRCAQCGCGARIGRLQADPVLTAILSLWDSGRYMKKALKAVSRLCLIWNSE